jgi:hypothetical protein
VIKYSAGFNYIIKEPLPVKVIAEQIEKDIENWTPNQIQSAFIALVIKNHPDGWEEIRTQIEKGFNHG